MTKGSVSVTFTLFNQLGWAWANLALVSWTVIFHFICFFDAVIVVGRMQTYNFSTAASRWAWMIMFIRHIQGGQLEKVNLLYKELTFNPYAHVQKSIAWLQEKLNKNGDFVKYWLIALHLVK